MTTISRTTLGLLATAVVTAMLAACGTGGGNPGEATPPPAPPTTSGSSTPDHGADLRHRLAAGLRDRYPTGAELVEQPRTTLTARSEPWLTGFTVVDVLNSTAPHPRRFIAALSDDGSARKLSGRPDEFSAITQAAQVHLESKVEATALSALYLDSTQDFAHAAYRIDAITDVRWLPKPTAGEEEVKQSLIRRFEGEVGPAAATKTDGAWRVVSWMIYDRQLERHAVTIDADGAVTDEVEIIAERLPVPYSY